MRASLKSILSVTLLSIAIAAFAQHGVAIPNAPPSRILADAHNQNADVIVFERAPEKTGAGPECDIYSVNADGTGEKALTHDGHSHYQAGRLTAATFFSSMMPRDKPDRPIKKMR